MDLSIYVKEGEKNTKERKIGICHPVAHPTY
jgi:hypothetical protein